MVEASIDQTQLSKLVSEIKRLSVETKRSTRSGAIWAGVEICRSLAAQTKVSPKRRKIISNYGRIKRSKGVAAVKGQRGVMVWRGGTEVFMPLEGAAAPIVEFNGRGGTPLVLFLRNRKTVTKKDYLAMNNRQIEKHTDLVNIKQSGLAKRSWKWLNTKISRGGTIHVGQIQNVGGVTWVGENLIITNKLKYIMQSLIGGEASVNIALANAYKSFVWKVNESIAKYGLKVV